MRTLAAWCHDRRRTVIGLWVAAFFLVAVVVILADTQREWSAVQRRRKPAVSSEVPFERLVISGD